MLDPGGGTTSRAGGHPEVVALARRYLRVPYVWGGATPKGFDCSGLVLFVYAKLGIELPHCARLQYLYGTMVARTALKPGDLVFFGTSLEAIHHVGIYIGSGLMINAPHTGDVVRIAPLNADYYGATRL